MAATTKMVISINILLVIGGVGIALWIGIRWLERKSLYFPMPFPEGAWDVTWFPGRLEDCTFHTSEGVRLHGWFAPASTSLDNPRVPRYTLLFCHGNAGNITHRLVHITPFLQMGCNVLLFDYRGYGKSAGTPDEQGLYLDAMAAYDYLLSRTDVDHEAIVVFGESLGGAVAVDLATKKPCHKLILESTFTSAKEMAKVMLRGFPIHYLIHSRFDSLSKIRGIHIPILCMHGTQDSIIPFDMGMRLFTAANSPKVFYEIQGANHNDTFVVGGSAYFERISRFISTGL